MQPAPGLRVPGWICTWSVIMLEFLSHGPESAAMTRPDTAAALVWVHEHTVIVKAHAHVCQAMAKKLMLLLEGRIQGIKGMLLWMFRARCVGSVARLPILMLQGA